jgi:hypothetical protein
MSFGVAIFLAIVLFLVLTGVSVPVGPLLDGSIPLLSIVSLVLLASNLPLALTLRGLLAKQGLRKIASETWKPPQGVDKAAFASDTSKLMAVYQTCTIVAFALLEGAGLFGCIAFLIEGQYFVLLVPGVVLLMLGANFPLEGRVRAWLSLQAERLDAMRGELAAAPR